MDNCENIGDGACRFTSGTDEQQPRRIVNMGCYRIVIWGHPLCGLVILLSITCRNESVASFVYHSLNWTLCIRRPCWNTYNYVMGRCGMDIEAVSVFLRAWRDDKTSALPFI